MNRRTLFGAIAGLFAALFGKKENKIKKSVDEDNFSDYTYTVTYYNDKNAWITFSAIED